ncbi:hypothetical protein AAY473_024203, partial [Plecturocebus cupreus]
MAISQTTIQKHHRQLPKNIYTPTVNPRPENSLSPLQQEVARKNMPPLIFFFFFFSHSITQSGVQ